MNGKLLLVALSVLLAVNGWGLVKLIGMGERLARVETAVGFLVKQMNGGSLP